VRGEKDDPGREGYKLKKEVLKRRVAEEEWRYVYV